jgi:SpoVK/Ycf46/Vps4 family AAA+-type ATPase
MEKKKRKRKHVEEVNFKSFMSVENLRSLIDIGLSDNKYQGIDTTHLVRILPSLIELDNIVGMLDLKKSVFNQIIYYLQGLHKRGEGDYLHTVITGSPGTGKTTVAEIIGNIYKGLGILSDEGSFKIAKREDFIAEYLGQTSIKTKKLLKSCVGGVLFIDEVYALGPGQKDKDSFSKEAIDTLNAFLSEHKNDFCCIVAGYEEEIKKCFFSVNPGLKRRFPWLHRIAKYDANNMVEIFLKMVKDTDWDIIVERDYIETIFNKNMDRFKFFGGDVETFLTKCKMAHARRVFSLNDNHKFILIREDIDTAMEMITENDIDKDDDEDDEKMFIHMYN